MVEYGEWGALHPESHEGRDRLFLIFAPSSRDGRYARQRDLLEGTEEGFRERDLLRGDVFDEEEGEFDGGPVLLKDVPRLREWYGLEPGGFAALLVGKDGTVKHRSGEPVEAGALFALVDAMPMRRREMRERGG